MNPPACPLSCVIFDVDGTLTRTNELIFASFNHVAEKYLGRRFAPEEIIALFGPPEEGAIIKVFGPESVDEVMEELLLFYASRHREMASLHAGIEEVLSFLKGRGIALAVFTGKGRTTTAITLDILQLSGYFDMVVSGNDVVRHKPDPEGILRVLERFGCPPESALMVGDSLSDIRAARAAGVPVASVLWDCYHPDAVRRENSDLIFERVEDLLAWFRLRVNGQPAGASQGYHDGG
jgi:HAD superfamily hydrolase (TIGR01509 family)